MSKRSDQVKPHRKKKSAEWKKAVFGSIAFLLLIAATFLFLQYATDFRFGALPAVLRGMDPRFMAAALLCLFLHIYSEGRALAAVGGAIGVQIGRVKSTLLGCAELFFAAVTPSGTGGQPATAYFLAKEGVKISKSSAILLTNTMHYALSLLLLGVGALIHSHALIAAETLRSPALRILLIAGFAANAIGVASCVLLMRAPGVVRAVMRPVYRLLARLRLIKNPQEKLASLNASIGEYAACHALIRKNPAVQLKTLAWNIVQKCAMYTIAYCVYRALGYAELSLLDMLCIQIIIQLSVNLLPLPGSAGAAELVTRGFYIGIYTGEEIAVSAMLLFRALSFYLRIVLTAAVTFFYHLYLMHRRRE